jgi:hypothetical protein
MAAKSSFARPIVVRSPAAKAPIIKISAPRAFATKAKRAGGWVASKAATVAREEKHRIHALMAAGAVGYAEKHGINLPHVTSIGTAATYGLGGWLALKSGYIRSRSLSHAVTGLLCVAIYQYTSGKEMAGPGVVLGIGGR